jgi:ADP-heptose:LPS heptosyltransferase
MLLWLGARRFHLLDDMSAHDYYATRNTFLFQTEGRRPFLPSSMSVSSDALLCRDLWMHRQLLAETIERAVTVEEILPSFVRLPEHSANCRNIAVAPFSSAAIKDFPEKLLCEALHEVRMHTKAPVELHGDASQRERLLRLMERLRLAGIENVECAALVGAQEFIQALAGARLVLTVDSAAAHIATALDRPCVILMGGGHYGQFGPWRRSARQVWLTHQMECFGCSWNCIHSEPYCLTHIARDSLRAAVAQALQQEAPK